MSASHVQEQWLPVPVRLVEAINEAPNLRSRVWAVAYLTLWVLVFHRTRSGKTSSVRDLGERAACSNHDRIRAALKDATAWLLLWEQPPTQAEGENDPPPTQAQDQQAQEASGRSLSRTVSAQPPHASRTPAARYDIGNTGNTEEATHASRTPAAHLSPDRARLPLQPTNSHLYREGDPPAPAALLPAGGVQPPAAPLAPGDRDRLTSQEDEDLDFFFEEEPEPTRSSVLVLPVRPAARKAAPGAEAGRPEAWALPVAEVLPAWLAGPLVRAGYQTLGEVCTNLRGQLAQQAAAQRWWARGRVRPALDALEGALGELGLRLTTKDDLYGAEDSDEDRHPGAQITPLHPPHPAPQGLSPEAEAVLSGWREGWRRVLPQSPLPPPQRQGDARAAAALLELSPAQDEAGWAGLAEEYLRRWLADPRRWPEKDPTPSTWAHTAQSQPRLLRAPALPPPDADYDPLADAPTRYTGPRELTAEEIAELEAQIEEAMRHAVNR